MVQKGHVIKDLIDDWSQYHSQGFTAKSKAIKNQNPTDFILCFGNRKASSVVLRID